ncbi:MAG: iron-containing alcohol dehydrogenase [Clostridiales bacterium]|jgi:alcohol dehydrogenase class IV|nr:iron-containing alcohol dehydrogenase [Eubacteriales bacterium]MDH7567165.1 iron-containing alcohol dehydrogenase [Clostridiales bacterium]
MVSKYSQLCPVTFGAGAIDTVGQTAKELGMTKVLVVTDKAIAAVGHPKKAIDSLKESGIESVLFDGVEMDAPDYTVVAGTELGRKEAVDGVVGIGGGSCLDTAKAISLFINNCDRMTIQELIRFNPSSPVTPAPGLKNIMVPTTSGTGSEVTFVAVITDTQAHFKAGCIVFPSAAIVDPTLTLGLKPLITVYTGMDAFSHCNEALCSLSTNPHSDTLALNAIERIVKWLPVAVEDPNNLEARENLAIASNFGGKAFQDSTVSVGHAIAHALGANLHVPHGVACAIITPLVIEHVAVARPEIYRKIGEIMGLDLSACDGDQIGRQVADAVRAMIKKLGIPSLKEQGFTRQQVLACADYARSEGLRNFCCVPVSDEKIDEMLAKAYDGYQ